MTNSITISPQGRTRMQFGGRNVAVGKQPVQTPAGALAWASDWGYGTGTDATTVRDNNRWSEYEAFGSFLLSSVAATARDFPSTNILRVDFNGENASNVKVSNAWAQPVGTGSGLYQRLYFRDEISNAAGDPSGTGVHQVQPNWGGGVPWAFKLAPKSTGVTGFLWFILNDVTATGTHWTLTTDLTKSTTYRIEWAFVKLANGNYSPHIRIYNSAGTQLYTEADFYDGEPSLASSGVEVDLDAVSPNHGVQFSRSLFVGNNGPGGWSGVTSPNYQYYGNVAVSITDWCGAYVEGEAN